MKRIIGVILILAGASDLIIYYLISGMEYGWLELVMNDVNIITMYGAWFLIGIGSYISKK
jgi:hypothetical protein